MLNGELKSLQNIWMALATSHRYANFVDERDLTSFSRRVVSEGITFLTKTLPRLGKALDSYHSTFEWEAPEGFKTLQVACRQCLDCGVIIRIPQFLSKAILASLDGDSVAVECVRQLTYMFYKLEVPYEDAQKEQVKNNFLKNEVDLSNLVVDWFDPIIRKSRLLIGQVLDGLDPLDITPRHPAGATACRRPNWEKYYSFDYYRKLDDFFPYSDYFFLSPTHLVDRLDLLEKSSDKGDPVARVCFVPKDSRGPRLISCEPSALMYIQQGLMTSLYERIETHYLTRGHVNFSDQSINRSLARESSLSGELATLDLKDASDLVSVQLVKAIFPSTWFDALMACRSEYTKFPTGEVVKLHKFAPMGSSCCFPVEALVFWALITAAGEAHTYVYGDDLIVPVDSFLLVKNTLSKFGLKLNLEKCYFQGPFRESCGGDFYNGVDVTPYRLRKVPGVERQVALPYVAQLCTSLSERFGDQIYSLINLIEREYGVSLPLTNRRDLPCAIRLEGNHQWANDTRFRKRFNKNLQRFEYRVPVIGSASQRYRSLEWEELLRKLLSTGSGGRGQYLNPIEWGKPGLYTVPHSVRSMWKWISLD